jgi:hypothetical protein
MWSVVSVGRLAGVGLGGSLARTEPDGFSCARGRAVESRYNPARIYEHAVRWQLTGTEPAIQPES